MSKNNRGSPLRKQVFDGYHGERFLSGKPLRNSRLTLKTPVFLTGEFIR